MPRPDRVGSGHGDCSPENDRCRLVPYNAARRTAWVDALSGAPEEVEPDPVGIGLESLLTLADGAQREKPGRQKQVESGWRRLPGHPFTLKQVRCPIGT